MVLNTTTLVHFHWLGMQYVSTMYFKVQEIPAFRDFRIIRDPRYFEIQFQALIL